MEIKGARTDYSNMLASLQFGEVLKLRTTNTAYQIKRRAITVGDRRPFTIEGNAKYCPEPIPANVNIYGDQLFYNDVAATPIVNGVVEVPGGKDTPGAAGPIHDDLDSQFGPYPSSDPAVLTVTLALRAAALQFARMITQHVPACADRTAAIRKVREAHMLACAQVFQR